jgi:CheY-like chemotaxis protein
MDETKPSVLIVEPDVLVRLTVAAYLRGCGFIVLETSGVDEASRVLESGCKVDVAFVELDAPASRSGFDFAQGLRRARPEIRIILTSGAARTAQEAGDLCEHGPFLTKPYDHRDLERHLRRLLAM